MANIKAKYKAIEQGLEPDDYSNHFYSHFGFYDEHLSEYSYGRYYNTPYDITTSTKP